ncbi:hypothetical protein [Sphingobacterium sp. JB170]|uniref:hypothetical protein n=1 Tax=Sphingobacterium sp. JB170 TaxID=1434842 RepID=UPI00097E8C0B|nr:hypothetical protein [Sphingobacterium sp. JB170]SJN28324.1 hypothetical protein FM107_05575 [Sphingobacterium sp. JB170]
MGFLKNLFTVDHKKNVEACKKDVDNRQNMYDWAKSVLDSRKRTPGNVTGIADSKKKVQEYKKQLDIAKGKLKEAKEKMKNSK